MPNPQVPPTLTATIAAIRPPAPSAPFRAHLDTLTKPLGSLGRLEDFAVQLQSLGITHLTKAACIFAADHGLAQEGVSAYPQEVTRQMVLNFLAGTSGKAGAAVNILARQHTAEVHIINCGVATPLPDHPALTNTPIRQGSRNTLHESAMTPTEFEAALTLGLEAPNKTNANLIAIGEMGIGNTSTASLLTAALAGRPLAEVTGRGTGLTDAAHLHKIEILSRVLALHQPNCTTPAEILRHLGGLEIAAMTAAMLSAAANGAAVILDGFISTAAAAFALALAPQVRPYLFAGHLSQEPGHRILLNHLHLQPILQLDMRLGEGSGAVLAMPILESALALYAQMATFTSAQVSTATETNNEQTPN